MSIPSKKADNRKRFTDIVCALSEERRAEGREFVQANLAELIQTVKGLVLSFSPLPTEIDMRPINEILIHEGRLILPATQGETLTLYQVSSLEKDLAPSPFGILQPQDELCEQVTSQDVSLAFIPGLGFDLNHIRLGRGKGHYDRLIPTLINALTVGVGFKEQLAKGDLPHESFDKSVDQLLLG